MPDTIYTIGHSTIRPESFVSNLKKYDIKLVVDVRSTPYSKFQPSYNRENLARFLNSFGIQYEFAGESLGGRSAREEDYEHNQVVYQRMSKNPHFGSKILWLSDISKNTNLVLMCSEKDPLDCHRTLLIVNALDQNEFKCLHIHSDGSVESQVQSMHRLQQKWGLSEDDLFQSDEERVNLAISLQEKQVAYKRQDFKDAV